MNDEFSLLMTNQNDLPDFVYALMGPPSLLPGETLDRFNLLTKLILEEIVPQTRIEWLWTIDLIESSGDVVRYRRLGQAALLRSREVAMQSILEKIDLVGVAEEFLPLAKRYTQKNVTYWRNDPSARIEIEQRLSAEGIDANYINVEVFIQAHNLFSLFDGLLSEAQLRRNKLLADITRRRLDRHLFGHSRQRDQRRL